MQITSPTEAARLLGVPEREVREVTEHAGSPVITMADHAPKAGRRHQYIVLPAGKPDANGNAGVLYFTAPHDRYNGTFPVYRARKVDRDAAGIAEEKVDPEESSDGEASVSEKKGAPGPALPLKGGRLP